MAKHEKGYLHSSQSRNDKSKISNKKDIEVVYQFFRYTIGTTLDCSLSTGILRNSITYYVRDLEDLNLLRAIYKSFDKHTHRTAKHYSANPDEWANIPKTQLSLFGEEVDNGRV